MHASNLCRLLCAGTLLGPLTAQAPTPDLGAMALKILKAWQPALGLDQHNSFAVNRIQPDKLLNCVDCRLDQYYQGVRVMGGEAILHLKGEHVRAFTDALQRKLHVETKPSVTPSEALAVAVKDLCPRGPFVLPPSTELVIVRMKLGPGTPTQQDALVYHIHTELENGRQETAHVDYLINAHTAAIAKKWNSLNTASERGTGKSQYSGTVSIQTNSTDSGFELRDTTRGDSGNTVLDLAHGTGESGGTIFTKAVNTWGDGQNYNGSGTTTTNGETAAVDAAYGAQWTWDYYQNIHDRKGIDGNGTATSMRVHYSTAYDNAFWSDSCFCMTFGDGSQFKSLQAMDVMGHEMSHGVCSSSAGLQYFGESGGLNEANSDINGTMVEFYSRGGSGATIGDKGGNWTMGEQLETPSFPTPLRYMYKPSKDGQSPDAWYSGVDSLDVHLSSGPMNRGFFFLSQGASAGPGDFHSKYLPKGMVGIGNDKAARIWYRALVSYMTSSTDYAGARKACIAAAQDLYGAGGREEQAVWNAFGGIKVGELWPNAANTVTATISVPAANVTVASGDSVVFKGAAQDSSPTATLSYAWSFGDGATAAGATATHTYANTGPEPVKFTATFTATDTTGASDTVTRVITVTPAPAPATPTETILNGGFETGTAHWEGNTEKIGPWKAMPPQNGKRNAWLLGSNQPVGETLYQFVVLPTPMTTGTLTFQLQVKVPNPAATAQDTLSVELIGSSASTTLATYSNLDASTGYALKTLKVPALSDRVVILLFRAKGTGAAQTSFALDAISLQVD